MSWNEKPQAGKRCAEYERGPLLSGGKHGAPQGGLTIVKELEAAIPCLRKMLPGIEWYPEMLDVC